LAEKTKKIFPDAKVSPLYPKWVAKHQIDAVIYALIHIDNEKEAALFCRNMADELRASWIAVWIPETMPYSGAFLNK